MAVQIWTHDQSPALRLAGADRLSSGISGGVGQLVKGFTQAAEERKRIGQVAKASQSFLKALSDEERETLNLPDVDSFSLLSGPDQIASVTGAMQAQGYKKAQSEMAQRAAHIKAMEAEQENESRGPAFLGDLSRYAPPGDLPYDMPPADFERYALPEGRPGPGLRELAASAGRTGYRPPSAEVVAALRQQLAGGGEVDWDMVKPREGKSTSGVGYMYGKGGQFQFLPDAGTEGQTSERTLSDGTLQSWNGKQWVNVPRAPAPRGNVTDQDRYEAITQEINALMRNIGLAVPGAEGDALRRQLTDARARRDALEKKGAPAGGGGAALPPKSELKPGQRYLTPRGPAVWDGEKFVKE